MKTKLFTILSLTGLFLFISTAEISAQYNFDDVVDQAVFSWGEDGEWDDGLVWNPSVIKDGDTLRMWYTGGNEIVWFGPVTKIGYAWSLDGVEWNRYENNPVLEADMPWEGTYLFGCSVIKDGNTFKMWYGASSSPGSLAEIIGYATSVNGKVWIKHPTPVLQTGPVLDWDETNITPQTVLKENGNYTLYYYGAQPGFPWAASMPQSGRAISSDGINWTKYDDPATTDPPFTASDPVLKVGGDGDWDSHRAFNPMVIKKGSGYEMCYVGASWDIGTHDIGFAQSDDGTRWNKYPEIVLSNVRAWGETTYGGTLLKYDDAYHLWYSCFHSNNGMADPQIGYAIATTPQQMVDDLIAKVEALEDAGVLNKGQANALIKKLESVQKSINQEKYNAAINKLHAFINQVNAFMNAGKLTAEQGGELISDAQAIIDILENLQSYKSGETLLGNNSEIATIYNLEQNHPNPFKSVTNISFTIPAASVATLKVYNSMGKEVATLFDQLAQVDKTYKVDFHSSGLANGIYICVLKTENSIQLIKMIKLK